MNILEVAFQNHNKWISIAKKYGACDFSEDVVQEMYIRLTKYNSHPSKILKDGKLNEFFVYVIIRNIVFDIHRSKKETVEINETAISEIDNESYDEKLDELIDIMQEELKTWHWYDQDIFKYVYVEGIGLRKLSRETEISLSSIFNTIKNGKQRIKEAIEARQKAQRIG